MKNPDQSRLRLIIPLLLVALGMVIPIVALVWPLDLTLVNKQSSAQGILTDPYYWRLIGFTLLQAFISALVSLLAAIPIAWFLTRFDFYGRRLILNLSLLPFVLPSILLVLGFILFYGKQGALNTLFKTLGIGNVEFLYSFPAIIAAHVFYNMPLAVRLLVQHWEKMPENTGLAAKIMGAGLIRRFFNITIPALGPALLTSLVLIFLYCLASFSIPLVLGGSPRYSTLEVEIYRFTRLGGDLGMARLLALIQLLINALILGIYFYSERFTRASQGPVKARQALASAKLSLKLWLIPYGLLWLIFLAGPLICLLGSGFTQQLSRSGQISWSLDSYARVLGLANFGQGQGFLILVNSAILGFLAVFLAIFSALFVVRSKGALAQFLERYSMAFMAISPAMVALGFVIIGQALDPQWRYLSLIVAHAGIGFPLAVRTLRTSMSTMPTDLPNAAQILGADQKILNRTIYRPYLASAVGNAASFVFAMSIGDLTLGLLMAPDGFTTLTMLLYRLVAVYRFQEAAATGGLLLLLGALGFLTLYGIGRLYGHSYRRT